MTELNEYECEMLDAMLEAFGAPGSLTRSQLLELFDQDETTAFAMVQILADEGLVTQAGKKGELELPEKLVLKPQGEKFLQEGGFCTRFRSVKPKPVEVNIPTPIEVNTGTLAKLQQQNMKLQNQKLENESRITNLQNTIDKQQSIKYFYWVLIVVALIIGYFIGHHKS